jgi:hypothetical protein
MRSVSRCYKKGKSRIKLAGEDVNTEVEEATALEAFTRQRLVKTQQTEKA